MQLHASCAARRGVGVLVIGLPGSGKSSLIVQLIEAGFLLVADDRVDISGVIASAPQSLRGLIEVRGLGLLRLPYLRQCHLKLVARFHSNDRLPAMELHELTGLPTIHLPPFETAYRRVCLALDSLLHASTHPIGAFT